MSASAASQGINVVPSSPHEDDTPPTNESDTSPQAPILALNGNTSSTIDLGTPTTTSARASSLLRATSIFD